MGALLYRSFMMGQDNCGIWTRLDPFFSPPNDKEEKNSLDLYEHMK